MTAASFDAGEDEVVKPPDTERAVLDLLHARYDKVSQGSSRRYAVAEHVRLRTGFAGLGETRMRTADFIAQDLWESKGLEMHGHEVKVSRGDWLRELAEPEKAEAVARYCHRWWVVVSDKSIVRRDELPEGWGLLAPRGNGELWAVKPAPLRAREMPNVEFQASLLRAVERTAATRGEVATRLREERDMWRRRCSNFESMWAAEIGRRERATS